MSFEQQLQKTQIPDGFIAALDRSRSSAPKASRLYGMEGGQYSGDDVMLARVHEMRTRIITSLSIGGDRIPGAILFENTIIPFKKVDEALEGGANRLSALASCRARCGALHEPSRAGRGEPERVDTSGEKPDTGEAGERAGLLSTSRGGPSVPYESNPNVPRHASDPDKPAVSDEAVEQLHESLGRQARQRRAQHRARARRSRRGSHTTVGCLAALFLALAIVNVLAHHAHAAWREFWLRIRDVLGWL